MGMNLKTHLASFESAVAATTAVWQLKTVDCQEAIGKAIDYIGEAGRVMVIGNGGSAAIAAHVANDLFDIGINVIPMFDPVTLTCLSNDYGYDRVFQRQVMIHGKAGDVLIAISSSGKSPNVLHAAQEAIERKMNLIGFTGFKPHNPLHGCFGTVFHVPALDYGIVEVAHQLILHYITDRLAAWYEGWGGSAK